MLLLVTPPSVLEVMTRFFVLLVTAFFDKVATNDAFVALLFVKVNFT
jgi:hypothetical protein